MKFKIFILMIAFSFLTISCGNEGIQVGKKVNLDNLMDSVAYSIGVSFGKQLKADSVEIDYEVFLAGLNDALKGDTVYLNDQQINQVMMKFQQDLQVKAQERLISQSKINSEKSNKFLAENKNKQGVKVTSSGLQYEVIKEGNGQKPTDTSTVKVHYKGTLIDGKIFDSSYERNQPATFKLNQVIPGWQEGLKLMSVGSKYRLYIPDSLAYGQQGIPPQIPPSSALIFEVELLEIVK